jgi:hypothetical protein
MKSLLAFRAALAVITGLLALSAAGDGYAPGSGSNTIGWRRADCF